jgi:5-methylcytosine-specific restriction endonuclease McrA
MERELRCSREERLELLAEGRGCPGIPHNWRPPGLTDYLRRVPRRTRQQVLERDGRRCLCCGATRGLKVEHIHPRADGGPSTTYNLQTLCTSCAALKGSRCLDFREVTQHSPAPEPVQPVAADQALAAA